MKKTLPLLTTSLVGIIVSADAFFVCNHYYASSSPRGSLARTTTNLYSSSSEKKQETKKVETPATRRDTFYLESQETATTKPASSLILGVNNFLKESKAIGEQVFAKIGIQGKSYIPPEQQPPAVLGLQLSNQAVKETERLREQRQGRVETNPISRALYDIGCLVLDELFDERPIARFWFLETIARIPYFTYVSMLHLYESLGWWRGVSLRKIHNAEEYNELHHLLIMESLGGNKVWSDRFLGYHIAIGYYWILCVVFLASPAAAYEFMELLESHAVDTYGTFLQQNGAKLKSLPPPKVAVSYYKSSDLYFFDDFQVSKKAGSRRPPCDNLYDVFANICEDEAEHVKTMIACQDYARLGKLVESPHLALAKETEQDLERKRQSWKAWAESINELDAYEAAAETNQTTMPSELE